MSAVLNLQRHVDVVDVGLRDGLQSVDRVLTTDSKRDIAAALINAGVREIEVASFAHPKVLPQLADAERLFQTLPRIKGVSYRALVPNLRGAERAVGCDVDTLVALVSCDEQVSVLNQGRTTAEVLGELESIGELAREQGMSLVVGLAMAYFAPCSGETEPAVRLKLTRQAVGAGASGIYYADTVGMAHPRQIEQSLLTAKEAFPGIRLGLHLHARNGFSLANVLTSLMCGVDWLESAFCGIGGDLWFPGEPDVLGNLPTEDLLAFTEALGVHTGIDSTRYQAVSALASASTGREPLDHLTRGGSAALLRDANWQDILANFDGATTTRDADRTSK